MWFWHFGSESESRIKKRARCLKAEAKAEEQEEYEDRMIEGQSPFDPKTTFTVCPRSPNKFNVTRRKDGAYVSQVDVDLYGASEMAYIVQAELKELAKR
jgi:hypothetical protein